MNKTTTYRVLVASLAIVYIAFGLPKVFGVSSVTDLIHAGFPFFDNTIIAIMGVGEVVLGIALLLKKTRSLAAVGIILHLLGTFSTMLFNFNYFFNSKTIFTLSGEFVFKNLVFIALALYILSVENNFRSIKFLNKPNDPIQQN